MTTLKQDGDVFRSLRNRIIISFSLLVGVLVIGTFGYKAIMGPEATLLDCFYMTAITISAVGFEEVFNLAAHPGGRIFTIVLIISGIGIVLYVVSNLTAFIVEGDVLLVFRRRRMDKELERMEGHYIVCGIGRVGLHIVRELIQTGRSAVAIDMSEDPPDAFREEFPDVVVLSGDAVDNELLLAARIDSAAGLIVATGHDKDNLVITMSARQLNDTIRIVTRCSELKNLDKLKKAGADSVVSANQIGGLRMASEMLRPTVVSFLDIMLRDQEKNLRVEEVRIPEGSQVAGHPVGELQLHSKADVLLLAVQRSDGDWQYNPSDEFRIDSGMKLIVMGSPEAREKVGELVA